MAKGKMTPRRQRFVDEYLVDCDGTKAIKRAGFKVKNDRVATAMAVEYLAIPCIAEAIAARQKELASQTQITQERVLAEYAKIAFSDMRKFAEWGADGVTLNESDNLDDGDAACVAEVSQSITAVGGTIKFKLHDKNAALKGICEILGYKSPDKTELTGANGGPIEINTGDAEACRARINELITKRGS